MHVAGRSIIHEYDLHFKVTRVSNNQDTFCKNISKRGVSKIIELWTGIISSSDPYRYYDRTK